MALDIRDQENDIWVWDFARETLVRVTFNPNDDSFPVWTPDGARIVSGGTRGLFSWAADGTGGEESLGASNNPRFAMSFSPDAKSLVVTEVGTSNDLALLKMDGKGQTTPLVATKFTEGLGEISPDGRWLAYQSNESGQNQIYVVPFPDVNSLPRIQVTSTGGTMPLWARRSNELFYLDGTGHLTTVPFQTKPAFTAGTSTRLFETRYFSAGQGRSYDVSPDGQGFLMIKQMQASDEAVNTNSLHRRRPELVRGAEVESANEVAIRIHLTSEDPLPIRAVWEPAETEE